MWVENIVVPLNHIRGTFLVMPRRFLCSLLLVLYSLGVYSGAHAQDVEPPRYETEHVDLKGLEIKNLKPSAWENARKSKKYVHLQAFQETGDGRLLVFPAPGIKR